MSLDNCLPTPSKKLQKLSQPSFTDEDTIMEVALLFVEANQTSTTDGTERRAAPEESND